MTVMDPKTGYIKGIVGGDAAKNRRPRFKPCVTDHKTARLVNQAHCGVRPGYKRRRYKPRKRLGGQKVTFGTWSPKNYTGRFSGPVTVRYALSQSLNTVAVQVLDKLGTSTSYDYLKNRLGITTLTDSDRNLAALALGGLTKGVTNVELTAAYCSFANKGVYIQPTTYTKILSHSDDIIYEKRNRKRTRRFPRKRQELC